MCVRSVCLPYAYCIGFIVIVSACGSKPIGDSTDAGNLRDGAIVADADTDDGALIDAAAEFIGGALRAIGLERFVGCPRAECDIDVGDSVALHHATAFRASSTSRSSMMLRAVSAIRSKLARKPSESPPQSAM